MSAVLAVLAAAVAVAIAAAAATGVLHQPRGPFRRKP